MMDTEILIVGAGPVGMLAALLAARQGLHVLLLEQAAHRHTQSRAVGIMPPSLEILRGVGLDDTFIAHGVPVRVVEIHGRSRRLGRLDFSVPGNEYPFALSLPQDRAEALLERAVLARPTIRFLRGHRVTSCTEEEAGVAVRGICPCGSFNFTGFYALGCDGGKSAVRQALKIPFDGAQDHSTFIMGDYSDTSDWGSQARFFLTPRGSIESFPLPEGKRRYVLRTPFLMDENATDYFRSELLRRTGIDLGGVRRFWGSSFRTERYLARSFCTGRMFLCGDAAHLMSPVGGQNMNIGFADAELATWLANLLVRKRVSRPGALRMYDRARRRAGRAASRRAQIMMRTGTSGGRVWSAVRNGAVQALLLSPIRRAVARPLSMQTIPFRNLAHCRSRFEKELMAERVPESF